MLKDAYKFKAFVEKNAFGVCERIGQATGMSSSTIRLYFIYTSFLTLGSPIIIYLIAAFWLDIQRTLRKSRSTIWDY